MLMPLQGVIPPSYLTQGDALGYEQSIALSGRTTTKPTTQGITIDRKIATETQRPERPPSTQPKAPPWVTEYPSNINALKGQKI